MLNERDIDIDSLIAGIKRPTSVLLSEQLLLIAELIERGLSYQQVAQVLERQIGRPVNKTQIYNTVKRFSDGDLILDRRILLSNRIREYIASIPKPRSVLTANANAKGVTEGRSGEAPGARNAHIEKMEQLKAAAQLPAKPRLQKAEAGVDVWSDQKST